MFVWTFPAAEEFARNFSSIITGLTSISPPLLSSDADSGNCSWLNVMMSIWPQVSIIHPSPDVTIIDGEDNECALSLRSVTLTPGLWR